jgi:CRP-like cAMP-binding protein
MRKPSATSVRTIWNTPDHHSPISTFFNAVHPLSQGAIDYIDAGSHPVEMAKGKFLIKPSQQSPGLFFIIKGVVRGYIKEEGKEITTWINEENDVVGSIRSLGLRIPSKEYIQAIEHCSLISIGYDVIEHLYEHFPETNVVGRKLLEENYRGAEERAYICRIPSAEKKYKRFMETNPGLINRVSLKYIASYLNMTNETLSRVRRRFPHSDPE